MKEIGERLDSLLHRRHRQLGGSFLCSGLLRLDWAPQMLAGLVLVFSGLMAAAVPAAMVHSSALAIALISTATFGYCGAWQTFLLSRDLFPRMP